jgi:hypothetical protein
MTEIVSQRANEIQKPKVIVQGGSSDSVYGLGFIGALVYYLSQAKSFQEGIVGFFKAMVWPAILVFNIFKLLKIDHKTEPVESEELSL